MSFNFWSRLTIRTKIIGAFAAVLCCAVGLGVFSDQRLGTLNAVVADIRTSILPSVELLGQAAYHTTRARELEASVQLAGDDSERAQEQSLLQAELEAAQQIFQRYEPLVAAGSERQLADAAIQQWQQYRVLDHKAMTLISEGDQRAMVTMYRGGMRVTFRRLQESLQKLIAFNVREADAAGDQGVALGHSATVSILAIISLMALICVTAAFSVVHGVSRPISAMATVMHRLTQKDMAAEIPGIGRSDEIGGIADAVQVFKDSMIRTDQLTAEQAAERLAKETRAAQVETLVQEFEKRTGQMVGLLAAAATELQSTAQSMSATATQTDQQANTVAVAAESASGSVQAVAAAAEELTSSIGEISRQVMKSAQMSGKAAEDARHTDAVVRALADGAQRIGDVVGLITTIAGQTNLLALNATIEAARAGDAGKGFAVVASEVKGLAQQTAKATDEIASQVAQIQASTREAVEAIRDIVGTVEEVSTIAAAIAAAVEEQGSATAEIARNVQQTAAGAQTVTTNIAGVSQAANETKGAADQVLAAASELSEQAEGLSTEVKRFADTLTAGSTLELRRQHAGLQTLVKQINTQLQPGKLPGAAAEVRSLLNALVDLLRTHLTAEEAVLYPVLNAHRDAAARNTGAKFASEMAGISTAFLGYSERWKEATIRADADGFIKASREIFATLGRRIETEEAILYPMADKAAA